MKSITVLYQSKRPLYQCVLRHVLFWAWLVFLAWISRDSTAWSLFCGIWAFATILAHASSTAIDSVHRFEKPEEAKAFIDKVSKGGGQWLGF